MIRPIGPLVVDLPEGFVDRTWHGFTRDRPWAKLTVDLASHDPPATPRELLAEARHNLEAVWEDHLVVNQVAQTTLLGSNAETVLLSAAREGLAFEFALAGIGASVGVCLTLASTEGAASLFEALSRTLEWARSPSQATLLLPTAWRRHYAGPLAFSLPGDFEGPRAFRYRSEDGAIRATLSIEKTATAPLWQSTIGLGDSQPVKTEGEDEGDTTVAGFAAREARCSLAVGSERYAVRRLLVPLLGPSADGRATSLVIVAREGEPRLAEIWQSFFGARRAEDPRT